MKCVDSSVVVPKVYFAKYTSNLFWSKENDALFNKIRDVVSAMFVYSNKSTIRPLFGLVYL